MLFVTCISFQKLVEIGFTNIWNVLLFKQDILKLKPSNIKLSKKIRSNNWKVMTQFNLTITGSPYCLK